VNTIPYPGSIHLHAIRGDREAACLTNSPLIAARYILSNDDINVSHHSVPDYQTDRVQEEDLQTNGCLSPHQPAAGRDRLEPARRYTTADNQPRGNYIRMASLSCLDRSLASTVLHLS
jgi:hypothetical protein